MQDEPRFFPLESYSQSVTDLVWPFKVRSNSPVSQSQILRVVSSLAVTILENRGWNDREVTGDRCPVRVCFAGARGNHSMFARFEFPGGR